MSFILEALKKADAERDRGAVPDLHAQGMLPEAAFEAETPGRGRPWLWLLAGVGLALIAGLAWQWMGSDASAPDRLASAPTLPAPAPAPAAVTAQPAATQAAPPQRGDHDAAAAGQGTAREAPHVAAAAATGAVASAESKGGGTRPGEKSAAASRQPAGVAATTAAPRHDTPGPKSAARAPVAGHEPGPESTPTTKPTTQAAAAAPRAEPPAAVSAAATPASQRVPLLSELPDDVRRQVPALKLGGLVYSAAPASRMLIVNGDIQREGSTVAPGLTLEHIKPKAAVFSLRGQRFEVQL